MGVAFVTVLSPSPRYHQTRKQRHKKKKHCRIGQKRWKAGHPARITQLQEKLNLLLHKRFAPSSEKAASGQFDPFFNEAEAETPALRLVTRQQQALPILDAMRAWLDNAVHEVAPGSLTGKTVHYLHQQWNKLIRYVEDGRLSIDNNACANAIRPFVIGRKAWQFCDTVAGAKASANLYSLVETAKANGLDPYTYLRRVFTELPQAQTVEDIEALLPYGSLPKRLSHQSVAK